MAGMGLIGAGGAAGTYEGLRDWMQGRRQKVVQGQRDEDRLREQALQNQALATEAADREYDIARQRILDAAAATRAGQETTAFQQEQADRVAADAAKTEMIGKIRALAGTDPRLTGVHLMFAEDAVRRGVNPSNEILQALETTTPKTIKVETVKNGRPVNMYLPEDQVTGQTFEEYRAPVQGSQGAPSGSQWVTPAGGGGQVYRVPQAGDAPYEKPTKGAKPPTIPAKQQDALIATDTSEQLLTELGTLYEGGAKNKVGPVSGRYQQGMQAIGQGTDENWAAFDAASATLENEVIKAITGAAVGVQEEARIKRQLPRPTDPPVQWQARYQQTLDNLRALRTATHRQIERAATHAAGGDISDDGLGQTPTTIDVTRPAGGAGKAGGGGAGAKRDPLGIL